MWALRNARNSPGASSGCKCAGTQNRPELSSSSPSDEERERVISSLEEYEGKEDEAVDDEPEELDGEGGGRSGSSGRAPGPVDEPDRRRRLLFWSNRRTTRCSRIGVMEMSG